GRSAIGTPRGPARRPGALALRDLTVRVPAGQTRVLRRRGDRRPALRGWGGRAPSGGAGARGAGGAAARRVGRARGGAGPGRRAGGGGGGGGAGGGGGRPADPGGGGGCRRRPAVRRATLRRHSRSGPGAGAIRSGRLRVPGN